MLEHQFRFLGVALKFDESFLLVMFVVGSEEKGVCSKTVSAGLKPILANGYTGPDNIQEKELFSY